jgi:hypothetical protein
MYKGTNPTCHDFNSTTVTPDSVSLLVGFSEGQVQLVDPIKKEMSKLYNEDVSPILFEHIHLFCYTWTMDKTLCPFSDSSEPPISLVFQLSISLFLRLVQSLEIFRDVISCRL